MSEDVVKLLTILFAILNGEKYVEDARPEALELGLLVTETDTDTELAALLKAELGIL